MSATPAALRVTYILDHTTRMNDFTRLTRPEQSQVKVDPTPKECPSPGFNVGQPFPFPLNLVYERIFHLVPFISPAEQAGPRQSFPETSHLAAFQCVPSLRSGQFEGLVCSSNIE